MYLIIPIEEETLIVSFALDTTFVAWLRLVALMTSYKTDLLTATRQLLQWGGSVMVGNGYNRRVYG